MYTDGGGVGSVLHIGGLDTFSKWSFGEMLLHGVEGLRLMEIAKSWLFYEKYLGSLFWPETWKAIKELRFWT